MDSTSNLFSHLDLADNFTSPRQKHMDDAETDLVEEGAAPSLNLRTGTRRKKHHHHWRDSGPRRFGGGNVTGNDTEQQHRRARLVQLINDTLEAGSSSKNQDGALQCEQNGVFNEAATVSRDPFEKKSPYHPRHRGSWRKKEKVRSSVFDGGDSVLKPRDRRENRQEIVLSDNSFRQDGSWRNPGQRRWAHNGYISPCYSAKNRISVGQGTGGLVDGTTCPSFVKNCNKNKMKGADTPCVSQPKTGQGHQRWSLPKNTGSGGLVQNGYPSNCKMAQDKNAANNYGLGTMVQGELFDGNSLHEHIVRPDSDGRHPDKKKGKMILEDNTLSDGQDNKDEFHSDRLCSIEETEVTGTAKDDYAFRSSEDIPWRRHDLTGKAHALPPEHSVCGSHREQGTSGHLSNLSHKIPLEDQECVHHVSDSAEINDSRWSNPKQSDSGSRGNQKRRKFIKGKRKCNLICSNYGGTSSSTFENLETFDLQSTIHNPRTRSTMTCDSQPHDDIYVPVMELNELQLPELRRNNLQELSSRVRDHSRAGVSQVESDEMLARQLQEQFYDEVAGSAGTEEIDATLAWSLQQEDAQQAASATRRFQSDNREASMAHLYAYYAELPYRNSSARWSDRAQSQTSNRRNYYSLEIDLETRLVAEARNFMGMDLRTRRSFLEELEAAFDHSNDALGSHHDFNENDYEMLLALDENIHQHIGASDSQINSLPQSVIQSDTVEEACAVCLENPTTGDTIRHLPCLHKFHRECIDTWLRRRTWCPVCKSEIA